MKISILLSVSWVRLSFLTEVSFGCVARPISMCISFCSLFKGTSAIKTDLSLTPRVNMWSRQALLRVGCSTRYLKPISLNIPHILILQGLCLRCLCLYPQAPNASSLLSLNPSEVLGLCLVGLLYTIVYCKWLHKHFWCVHYIWKLLGWYWDLLKFVMSRHLVVNRGFINSRKHDFVFDVAHQSSTIGGILVRDKFVVAVDS